MRRTTSALLGLIITTTATHLDAAPPTEADWWMSLGQYAGTFDITTDTGEPGGQYSLRWEEPFVLARFDFHTTGGPLDSSSGLCFWHPENERCEFGMVQEGPEGRLIYDGHMVDAGPGVVTWACRASNASGVVRTFTAVDTFSPDGNLVRTFKDVTGEPFPVTDFVWTRVNPFLDHFPCAEACIGSWSWTQGGEQRLTTFEWGAGRRSLRQSDYRIAPDGSRVLTATCDYMHDPEHDRIVGHYLDEFGVNVWGHPTITEAQGAHTITTDWSGKARNARVSATTSLVIDADAGTMTSSMRDFRLEGSGFPDGPMEAMATAPTVMTRQK